MGQALGTYEVRYIFKDEPRQVLSREVLAESAHAAAEQVRHETWSPRFNGDAVRIEGAQEVRPSP